MAIERMNPEDVYQPYMNAYTQVIKATGTTQVHVAGTVSLAPGRKLVGEGDMAAQVRQTVDNIAKSLAKAGATLADVVRVNTFVTDVDRYLQEGHVELVKAFGAETLPTSTLVGVTRLADPRYLVEIQATAVID